MLVRELNKLSDFTIRVIMMATTILVLIYLTREISSSVFILSFLSAVFIVALIVKGITDFMLSRKK